MTGIDNNMKLLKKYIPPPALLTFLSFFGTISDKDVDLRPIIHWRQTPSMHLLCLRVLRIVPFPFSICEGQYSRTIRLVVLRCLCVLFFLAPFFAERVKEFLGPLRTVSEIKIFKKILNRGIPDCAENTF